jgi:hypothetical protein
MINQTRMMQQTTPSNLQQEFPSNLQQEFPSNLQQARLSNLEYSTPSILQQLPSNMINQTRMMQQANIMNTQNQTIPDETVFSKYNGKTENIKDMINKLSTVSSEVAKKCKIVKLNNPKTESFNNIDTYNNAFMENFSSF